MKSYWFAAVGLVVLSVAAGMAHPSTPTSPTPQEKAPELLKQNKQDQQERNPSFWMKRKLEYSQKILEGITLGDFKMVSEQAEALQLLNRFEHFARNTDKQYTRQLSAFRSANEQLIEMANDENLEGATLAFHQLTNSCVGCHKIIRGEKIKTNR